MTRETLQLQSVQPPLTPGSDHSDVLSEVKGVTEREIIDIEERAQPRLSRSWTIIGGSRDRRHSNAPYKRCSKRARRRRHENRLHQGDRQRRALGGPYPLSLSAVVDRTSSPSGQACCPAGWIAPALAVASGFYANRFIDLTYLTEIFRRAVSANDRWAFVIVVYFAITIGGYLVGLLGRLFMRRARRR